MKIIIIKSSFYEVIMDVNESEGGVVNPEKVIRGMGFIVVHLMKNKIKVSSKLIIESVSAQTETLE